jgi:hypothetical protein
MRPLIRYTGDEKRETQIQDAHPPPAPVGEEAQEETPPAAAEAMQIDNNAEELLEDEAPEQGPQPPPPSDPEAAYDAYPDSGDDDNDKNDHDNENTNKQGELRNIHNFDALPPELASAPPGECNPEVQSRVARWLELQRDGRRLTDTLRSSRDYRNPEFFKKMVEYWEIDEHGTAFTAEMFNPGSFPVEDSIEELKKEWTAEDKKKKAGRAAGTSKIEFTGAGGSGSGGGGTGSSVATSAATAAAIKAAQAMAQKLAANRGR